ncbi:complement factor H-like [Embiotoca jacksoni]|uniref:complement factor H-like n=1 Tax=Embiotoca jacksoni TaxID=100190 RepID=UPI00370484EF
MHVIIRSSVLIFLWMHTLTFVKSNDCTLEMFLNSNMYDSNFDTTSMQDSYTGGNQVRVGCNVGFSGFFKLTCTDRGWLSAGSKCEPRSCGHPGDALYADFELEVGKDFVFGSKVAYTCHRGYQMVTRTNYRRCMAGGWDGVIPVCEAQKCAFIHVDSNVQVMGDPEEATYGNVVRFSCKSKGLMLSGLTEIYCNEYGEWSGQAPKCQEIKCTAPVIDNGSVRGGTQEYKENSVLDFGCERQYEPVDRRTSKCIKVGSKAEWSPTPLCKLKKCKLPTPRPVGTQYNPPYQTEFLAGDTVTVTCGERYGILNSKSRSAVIACNENVEWDNEPECIEVKCNRPEDPHLNRWPFWAQTNLDSTVRYSCITGYQKPSVDTVARCTRDGWMPALLCQAKGCKKITIKHASISNNNKARFSHGEEVQYTCTNSGTQFTVTCDRGQWHGILTCPDKLTCESPPALLGGDTKNSVLFKYNHNDRVEYICQNLYTMEGEPYMTCINGQWTGRMRCLNNRCPIPPYDNGFVVVRENKLYYSCEVGYKLSTKGWWGEAECDGREWSGLQPCIDKRLCGQPPVIPNGKFEEPYGQSLKISCNTGYLPQFNEVTCQNGTWPSDQSFLKSLCTPDGEHCLPPPKVENAVVPAPYQKKYSSGSEVTYKCRDKYTTAPGEDKIRCTNGEWEEKNITCTLYCDKIKDEKQTMRFTSNRDEYLNGEIIDYQCVVPEETAEGAATCVDGQWKKTVECKVKPCELPDTPNGYYNIIIGDELVFGTVIQYFCNEGYQMVGKDDNSTCLLEGWSKRAPICERITCEVGELLPNIIADGLPSANEGVMIGGRLWFRCTADYDLDGQEEIRCLRTGQWNSPFPTCLKRCNIPILPNNLRITSRVQGNQLRKGEMLTFVCQVHGQLIQGMATLECLADGQLSHAIPTCEDAQTCATPPALLDGDTKNSVLFKYNNNDRVEYICQNFYTMEGESYMTCLNGQWTGRMRCLKPCTVNKDDLNSHNIMFTYTYEQKLYSTHNDVINFMCVRGHRHDGVIPMRQWCIDACSKLPLVPLAFVSDATQKAEYEKGDVIDFTCETGYISSSTIKYVCIAGGWLEVLRERCYLKPCELPDDTPNGYYKIIIGDELVFGTVIQYFCNEGYQMVGKDDNSTCLLEGWSKRAPICERITCEVGELLPNIIADGLPSANEGVMIGGRLWFRCTADYDLDGQEEIRCLRTGQWNSPFPTCLKRCNIPILPNNLRITSRVQGNQLRKGEMLTFVCQVHGQLIQGMATLECLADGQLSHAIPTCEDAQTCATPPALLGGDTKNSVLFKYNHNDRVEYICQNLYTMEGEPYMTCLNGQWTGRMRCLKPCTVNRDDLNSHNIMFRYTHQQKLYSTHNDVIDFVCLRGRRHDGVQPMRQWCIDGVMNLPTCQ